MPDTRRSLKDKAKKLFGGKTPVRDAEAQVIAKPGPSSVPARAGDEDVSTHLRSKSSRPPRKALTIKSLVSGQVVTKVDLWQQAFEQLSSEQKQKLSTLAGDGKTASGLSPDHSAASAISDLISQTRARQEECEKRAWRIKLGQGPADEIILRDQTALIISWLTKAGDIGIQFAPTVVTQVWPCVKAILNIPVNEANQMAALLTITDKIAQATARGGVYEMSFNPSNTSTEALDVLHNDLVALYKASLELLCKAVDLLGENLFKRTGYSLLHPDAIKETVTAFSSLEEQLAKSVQAASAHISGDLLQRVRDLEAPITRVDERVSKILESISEDKEQEYLEWMSAVPYHGHHDEVVQKRMADTCDWLLRHPKFGSWEASSGRALFWLRGVCEISTFPIGAYTSDFCIAGTGKTFLTSKVIDHKSGSLLSSGAHDEALAFFYFSRSDSSRNSILSCLQSLVRQLSTSYNREGHMQPALKELAKDCKKKGRVLSRDLCEQRLAESMNLFPRTTIILDALDECKEDDREGLVKTLSNLMKSSSRPLLVFISSRPDNDISSEFQDWPSVEVGVEDNQDDIAKFVKDKITNANTRWKGIPGEVRERVVLKLLEKSQGMFRWAALQVYELLKLPLLDQVEARLGKLPNDLKETYDDIYRRQGEDPSGIASKIIDRAIMWVMVARKPLESEQLLTAVRIDPVRYIDTKLSPLNRPLITQEAHEEPMDDDYIVKGEVDEEQLLDFCANLLTLNSKTHTWAFAHASVAEYFEGHHFRLLDAHGFVGSVGLVTLIDASRSFVAQERLGAMQCLTHSRRGRVQKPMLSKWKGLLIWNKVNRRERPARDADHPFVSYVFDWWMVHVGLYDGSLQVSKQGDKASSYRSMTLRDLDLSVEKQAALLKYFISHPNDGSPAFRGILGNLHTLEKVEVVPGSGSALWLELPPTEGRVSLQIVAMGFFNLLQSWWQASPSPCNVIDSKASGSSEPLIDTAVRSKKGWSLLHVACKFDRAQIVEALLAAGVNPSEQNEGYTALSVASANGHIEPCRILIETFHCSPDWPRGKGNPLYQAVNNDYDHVVRYLLSKGADPTQSIKHYGSLIALAAHRGSVKALQVLIDHGRADPNMLLPDPDYIPGCGTAAIQAAYNHRYDALEALVRHAHVDVNAHIATGHYKTVAIAFIAGLRDRRSAGESLDLLRCVRDLGVDFTSLQQVGEPTYSSSDFSTDGSVINEKWALGSAVLYGDVGLVHFLVEDCGLDFTQLFSDSSDRQSLLGNALLNGASAGDLMDFLISRGAEVNLHVTRWDYRYPNTYLVHGETYGNALAMAAAEDARGDIKQYLLDRGADINIALLDWTRKEQPLYRGSSLRWLCENGADVNLQVEHDHYGSALVRAVSRDWQEEVQCLLDYGAEVNLVLHHGDFRSALMAAVGCNRSRIYREEMVKILLDHGADINLQTYVDHDSLTDPADRRTSSALMVAAEAGDEDLTLLLIVRGADVNLPENQGWQETLKLSQEEPRVWLTIDVDGSDLEGSSSHDDFIDGPTNHYDSESGPDSFHWSDWETNYESDYEAQKHKAPGTPETSGRRRSGRISSSGQKSKYFEGDSGDDEDELDNSDYQTPSNGNSTSNRKKRGRPAKKAAAPSKKAKFESDADDGDEYADDDSDVKPESDAEEVDDEDDEDAPPRVTITPLVKLREIGGVPYEESRLHKNTLLFLKDLKANNKRSWLKSNDKEYRRSLDDFHSYVTTLTTRITTLDPTIPELPIKDVIFRVYRDIRFSKDPTPYKPYYSAAFSRTGRKGPYACYYVHCEPGSSFVGGGLWQPDAAALAKLRRSIDRQPQRWREMLAEDRFRKVFLPGVKAGDREGCVKAFCKSNKEGALKTKPKGFDADHRDIELLKLRNFTIGKKGLPDSIFTDEDGQDKIGEIIRAMVGFVTFLNDVVMPDPNLDDTDSSSDEEEEGEEGEEDNDDEGDDGA
ncbi:hypothetical protein N0V82_007604 [Gnomoniopsis sp. IMI 355080]|nr:hypothetical protein N0V82_007604 [Gnomoniopsis sp. IMI 355080]